MNYGMERCPELTESVKELAEGLIAQRIENWKNGLEKDKNNIKEALCQMSSGKEGGSITMSPLRGESITGQHDFYMAYYDSDIFVEEEPGHKYICMAGFMEAVDKDVSIMEKEIRNNYIRVYKSESAYVYSWYTDMIYEKIKDVFAEIVEGMEKEEGIAVYYGGYMEEQVLVGYI